MNQPFFARVLVVDAAPGPLLFEEMDAFLRHGFEVTLNLRNVPERDAVRQHYGERLSYADFDGFAPQLVLAALARDGIGYEVLKTRVNVPIDRAVIEGAVAPALQRRLAVIAQAGVGVDHIDVATATRQHVLVTNTPGSNADAVAEFALCQMLALTRHTFAYNTASHDGVWAKSNAGPVATELSELTLGLVGIGNIARRLAAKAHLLGMRVMGYGSARFTPEQAATLRIERKETLDELLGEADVVSLHAPLNEATRHLIGAPQLRRMKPGAVLINTARGGLVDEQALADVLSDPHGPLAGAAIDTFAKEKAQYSSPLIGIDKALLSPHIAGTTRSAIRAAALQAVENAAAILAGREGASIVNPQAGR
ncbi:NAD(P)-dependent oxidoreductase [Trinickia fusca]|uniref:Hydroxyacid dehydrogenase n=1 Tax=Trinickia fusca TaxID=2419777 RepID=A0A494XD55_9BURK|nr:NAD(P)-dependent oxidoreductase [Trinickia fusca]RKP46064.1 hypothetical protein D7S89_19055 [Trinickia fusca]